MYVTEDKFNFYFSTAQDPFCFSFHLSFFSRIYLHGKKGLDNGKFSEFLNRVTELIICYIVSGGPRPCQLVIW